MCRMTFAAAAAPSGLVVALVVTRPMLAQQEPEQAASVQLGRVANRLGGSLTGGVLLMLTTHYR